MKKEPMFGSSHFFVGWIGGTFVSLGVISQFRLWGIESFGYIILGLLFGILNYELQKRER